MTGDLGAALRIFSEAAEYVRTNRLEAEVEWQRRTSYANATERDLLRETAWVILCTGFRESVVRKVFDYVSLCFCDWESSAIIIDTFPACRDAALATFRNRAKLDAIVETARQIHAIGFASIKQTIHRDPINELQRFPYIGPVTAWHLAKNLGFDVAKPDRHLARISRRLGYQSAWQLCDSIAAVTGETVKVIDLILWRYLADSGRSSFSTE